MIRSTAFTALHVLLLTKVWLTCMNLIYPTLASDWHKIDRGHRWEVIYIGYECRRHYWIEIWFLWAIHLNGGLSSVIVWMYGILSSLESISAISGALLDLNATTLFLVRVIAAVGRYDNTAVSQALVGSVGSFKLQSISSPSVAAIACMKVQVIFLHSHWVHPFLHSILEHYQGECYVKFPLICKG